MFARKLADRWLLHGIARFVSWVCLAVTSILAVIIFATAKDGNTAFGSNLGADYGAFYVVGEILNEGRGQRLYDLDFQDEKLHQVLPLLSRDEHLPFVYPAFVGLIFKPLAKLPFAWSVAAWMSICIGLYALSVGLVLRTCESIDRSDRSTAWLLALSFQPFAIECCLGGHISAIGFTAIAAGLMLQQRGKPIRAGLAFSLLVYKPTLLLLIGPMLVVSRSWRILAGLIAGGLILAVISWLVVGLSGCLDYINLLLSYGRMGGSVGQGFKTIKFVDLTAFLRLLGVTPGLCRPMAFGLGLPILIALLIAWARTRGGRIDRLTWAATVTLMPVVNIYAPIYDVTMIVPGVLLGAIAIRLDNPDGWPVSFRWLLTLLYLTALVSQPLALRIGFQAITIGILAMGCYFLALALRDRPSTATFSPNGMAPEAVLTPQ
jgi:alpha-1,2-mannosyltransferase